MFLLALWPIYSDSKGRAKASAVSQSSCYTVLVYALWSVLSVRALGERWSAFASGAAAEGAVEASTLNHRIYHLILIVLLTHHWVIPVCIWPEARALAKYLNAWTSFQAEWCRLTGRPLVLGLRRRAVAYTAVGLLLPLPLVLLMVRVGMPILHAVAFFPPLSFFSLVGGVWTTLCRAVEHSASSLRQLHSEDRDRGLGLLDVRAHGMLWLHLRALASQTGAAQSSTLVVYTVYSMALGLVAAMGVLIALTHADLSLGNVMQALFMVQNLHHIYTVHEHGHRAAHSRILFQASKALQFEMLSMKPPLKEKDLMNAEVRTLLIATAAHSEHDIATISVGGFAACSRSSIIEVYNMLLLNLLVLLQFAYFAY
ncbi:gustatory and odorant receptor 63a-like [Thrips palmi]|uniref:Gustatory and odorant receptor 63a-like n=1 Tax=Thrips palmi TaxID=161013 RepID=A0A6P8ZJ14_THRPL|nr:gustatory and odorant receptor 63a-like [Thrips palmi]